MRCLLPRIALSLLLVSVCSVGALAWTQTPAGSGNYAAGAGTHGSLDASGGETVDIQAQAQVLSDNHPALMLNSDGYLVTNQGEILSSSIRREINDVIINSVGAQFQGQGELDNQGDIQTTTLSGGTATSYGVIFNDQGQADNSGTINAQAETLMTEAGVGNAMAKGVYFAEQGELVNSGAISANAQGGLLAQAQGAHAKDDAVIENSGVIEAATESEHAAVSSGVLVEGVAQAHNTETGEISATAAAGTVSEACGVSLGGGELINDGVIDVDALGAGEETVAHGVKIAGGSVVNTGDITAYASGGAVSEAHGVVQTGEGTVTNSGWVATLSSGEVASSTGVQAQKVVSTDGLIGAVAIGAAEASATSILAEDVSIENTQIGAGAIADEAGAVAVVLSGSGASSIGGGLSAMAVGTDDARADASYDVMAAGMVHSGSGSLSFSGEAEITATSMNNSALAYGMQSSVADLTNEGSLSVSSVGPRNAETYGMASDSGNLVNNGVVQAYSQSGGVAYASALSAEEGSVTNAGQALAMSNVNEDGVMAYAEAIGSFSDVANSGLAGAGAYAAGDSNAYAAGVVTMEQVNNSGEVTAVATGETGDVLASGVLSGATGAESVNSGSITALAGSAGRAGVMGVSTGSSLFANTESGNITAIAMNTSGSTGETRTIGLRLVNGGSLDNQGVIQAGGVSDSQMDVIGVQAQGGSLVTNSGSIQVETSGAGQASVVGVLLADGSTLANSGSIGQGSFIETYVGKGAGPVTPMTGVSLVGGATVVNTGVIHGEPYAILSEDEGADSVTNSGTLDGDVALGGGDDQLTLLTGSIVTGSIDGGAGDDSLTLTGEGDLTSATAGFEDLLKNGDGIWVVHDIVIGEQTTIAAGTLKVEGNLDSPQVTIANGGALDTSGDLSGQVDNHGVILADSADDRVDIEGSLIQHEDGTIQVVLNSQGDNSLINVTGAPGAVSLQGGEMRVDAEKGYYKDGQFWSVIQSEGGVSGTFDVVTVTPDSIVLNFQTVYLDDAVRIALSRASYTEFARPCDSRQLSVAEHLDAIANQAEGDMQTVIVNLDYATADEIQSGLNQMHPEPYSAFDEAAFELASLRDGALDKRMDLLRREERRDPEGRLSVFADVLGNRFMRDGACDRSGYSASTHGLQVGLGYDLGSGLTLGLAGGVAKTDMSWDSLMRDGDIDSQFVSAFGIYDLGDFFVQGAVGWLHMDNSAERSIRFADIDRNLDGDFEGDGLTARVKAGYTLRYEALRLEPFAGLDYARIEQESFSETGGDSLNLEVRDRTLESARTNLGVTMAYVLEYDGFTLIPELSGAWSHELLGDPEDIEANLAGNQLDTFKVDGAESQEDEWRLSAGVSAVLDGGLSINVGLTHRLQAESTEFSAGLGYRF